MRADRIIGGQREFPDPFSKLESKYALWNRVFTNQLHPEIIAFEKAMRGVMLCHFGIDGGCHIGEYAGLLWERIGDGLSLEAIRLCINIEAIATKGPSSWELVSSKIGLECGYRFRHIDSERDNVLNKLNAMLGQVETSYSVFRQLQRELLTVIKECDTSCASVTGVWHMNEHEPLWSQHCYTIAAAVPSRGEKIKLQRLPGIYLVTEHGNVLFKNVQRISVS